jgi:pimeloyl-ACP methyl ester carboxylesterase
MRKKLWTGALITALAVGGLAAGSQAAAGSTAATLPAPTPISWGACSDPGLVDAGAVCGFLTVPLDYSDPSGAKIKIAVSKVEHTVPDSQYQGVMLVNPGGPGGSGVGLATLGSDVPNGAGDYYDWIGFDPRGVGDSQPHVSCIPDYFAGPRPEYIPSTAKLEKIWLKRSQSYAAACAKNGPILSHLTTAEVARDMDYLRAALGQKQINYFGFSYGTYLGEVYSTLFPNHVRRMVWDSTVDPRGVWYGDNLDQDVAFERTENKWFDWLAKYNDVYHLGTSGPEVRALWFKVKQELTRSPAGGVVGPDEWADIFLYAGYYQLVWLDLGNVFASWVHNDDYATLHQAYEDYVGPNDDNGFAIYLGVQCTDTQFPTSWDKVRLDNWRTYAKAPFYTWGNAWFNEPCQYWPAKAHKPISIDGSKTKNVSVLMIDETLDAATPYPGSLYVRSLYPGARLIAEKGGTTHAGTLYGNECVDGQIADYLADGTLPARQPGYGADTYCKPLPQPVPDGATAKTAAKKGAVSAATLGRLRAATAAG